MRCFSHHRVAMGRKVTRRASSNYVPTYCVSRFAALIVLAADGEAGRLLKVEVQ